MTEKRISDLSLGIVMGVFVIGIFTYALIDMDNNTKNNDNLHVSTYVIYEEGYNSNLDSVKDLNPSSSGEYVVQENTFIDTRGQAEANIMSTKSKSTILNFFSNDYFARWDYGKGLIVGLILGLLGVITITLFIRSMLGSYRI